MTTQDFTLADHGSLCLLYTVTKAAVDWADEWLPADAMRSPCGGIVIEPRFVEPIVEHIWSDGLHICN